MASPSEAAAPAAALHRVGKRPRQEQDDELAQEAPSSLGPRLEPKPLVRRVFISHTGADEAAKTFAASILKPALEAAGLRTFIDFRDLAPGCEWPAELVDTAAHSAVFVAVLSKTYTHRFWCMLELDAALHGEPGQPRDGAPKVIPVFYDSAADVVRTAEVQRHWQARLAAAAASADAVPADRRDWVRPERWAQNVGDTERRLQNVRRQVAPPGLTEDQLRQLPPAPKDDEWQMARRVVVAALQAARDPLALPDGTVGFEQQAALLLAELAVDDPERLGLWLHGMGGSGKSTMAMLLYNHLSQSFPKAAFVQLNTDGAQGRQVQQGLFSALEQLGAVGMSAAASPAQLLARLRALVAAEPVLLVVDNVWTAAQLDGLLPTCFHAGSRLVITSRSSELGGSTSYKALATKLLRHQLELLSPQASLQLFRDHAGPLPTGADAAELASLEAAVVRACRGLPLALRIAGGQLWQEPNPNIWREVLASLTAGAQLPDASSEDKLRDVLTAGFNSLSPAAQNMFLDTASVLHGFLADTALQLWSAWWGGAEAAFKELQRRSLVTVNNHGRLLVHDVIRSAARSILHDAEFATPKGSRFYGSRLWVRDDGRLVDCSQGTREPLVAMLLEKEQEVQEGDEDEEEEREWVKGVAVVPVDLSTLDLGQLRFLQASGIEAVTLISSMAGQQQPKLLFCSARCMPLTGLPESLVQLSALHHLDVSGCGVLTSLPEAFGRLSALRHLNLKGCSELSSLPESFGQLSALQHLDLTGCEQLASLPESFVQLSALQQLSLGWCAKLASLPELVGQLSALQRLSLRGCLWLGSLPESFGQLRALQYLNLSGCSRLSGLPESFGQLSALQDLEVRRSRQLGSLPESFGRLSALQRLYLSGCSRLASLPESFGQLSVLQHLDISWCEQLTSLPKSFGQLVALQSLNLVCGPLSSLPEAFSKLPALQHLDLRQCEQLTSLPDSFGQLSSLQHLSLSFCEQLARLPESFGQLSALQHLDLSRCEQLSSLPGSFGRLLAVKHLNLSGCSQLQSLPESFGRLATLQYLDLSSCSQLASLPKSFGQLSSLQHLNIIECSKLASLPETFGQLRSLKKLNVTGCSSLCAALLSAHSLELTGSIGLNTALSACASINLGLGLRILSQTRR